MSESPKKIVDLTYLIVSSQSHLTRMMQDFFLSMGGAKVEYVRNSGDALLHLRQGGIADVVIVDYDERGEVLELARHIRWGRYFYAPELPIVTIGSNWTQEKVQQARNIGINEIVSFPISTHILMGRLLSAINSSRLFISTENYRGPDRRRGSPAGFTGPFRRASDRISEQLKAVADKKAAKGAGYCLPSISIPVRPLDAPKVLQKRQEQKAAAADVEYTPFRPSTDFSSQKRAVEKVTDRAAQRKEDVVGRPFPAVTPSEIEGVDPAGYAAAVRPQPAVDCSEETVSPDHDADVGLAIPVEPAAAESPIVESLPPPRTPPPKAAPLEEKREPSMEMGEAPSVTQCASPPPSAPTQETRSPLPAPPSSMPEPLSDGERPPSGKPSPARNEIAAPASSFPLPSGDGEALRPKSQAELLKLLMKKG
jgi:CheY-like chemotaxis protein